jgi:pimeloyl-ACP methyl ester carboxylesterase
MPAWLARRLWKSDLLMWLVRTYLSGVITTLMGVPKDLPLSTRDQERITEELDGIFPVSQRIDGILFDAFTGNKEINHGYPLEMISAPTLVIHFRDDTGAPYQGAAAMAHRIPTARLLTLEHGGHLGLGDHPEIPTALRQFLRDLDGASG